MRRIGFLLFAVFVSCISAYAQTRPLWVDDFYRSQHWPQDIWYVGFQKDKLTPGGNVAAAIDAVKRDAMNSLSESIVVMVTGETSVFNFSSQISSGVTRKETTGSEYRQNLRTATQSIIANQAVETWHDSSEGYVYAFASVRKSDLGAFYAARINLALDKASSLRKTAMQYENIGRRVSAKEKMSEAIEVLSGSEYYFTLLSAVDPSSEILSEYQNVAELYAEMNGYMSKLGKGPSIYIDAGYKLSGSEDDAFRSDPHILEKILKSSLSEAQFQISDEIEDADYILKLVTYTSMRSKSTGGFGMISYYANADGVLTSVHTGKELLSFSIFRDPECFASGSSAEQAGTKAFKTAALSDNIISKILNSVQK